MILGEVSAQGLYFGASVFCGIICGLYYDALYTFRILCRAGKALTVIADIVFCALSAASIFYFLYITNGFDVKWYMYMGLAAGFVAERACFKKPVAYAAEKVYNLFAAIYRLLLRVPLFKKILK